MPNRECQSEQAALEWNNTHTNATKTSHPSKLRKQTNQTKPYQTKQEQQ